MSLFEFVTVMISMILALSLGQLLTNASYLIKTNRRVKWHTPYVLWICLIGLILVNHWWALWDFNDINWNYASFLYILIAPTLIAFAVGLLATDRSESGSIDLSMQYSKIRRPFTAVFFTYVLVMWFDGPLLAGQDALGVVGLLHAPIIVALIFAFLFDRVRANTMAPVVALFMVVFIMITRFLDHIQ